MESYKKKKMLKTIFLLEKTNTFMTSKNFHNNEQNIIEYLTKCQNIAIDLGNALEYRGEKEAVSVLEEYCENIYKVSLYHQDDVKCRKIYKKISKELKYLNDLIGNNLPDDKKEIIFLPYKASMWDSLESVWRAAYGDEKCVTYVIPIPYYDKNPDGSFGELHYEGDEYPEYVPVTLWNQYDLKEQRPDIAYIHNPYDDWNRVTSVYPDYYVQRLKEYVGRVIYIPYFLAANEKVAPHFCTMPGIIFSDKVIVQSEEIGRIYVEELKKFERENNCKGIAGNIEEKISGLGSPKYDRLSSYRVEEENLPDIWKNVIYRQDGSRKKVILYNTSIQDLLIYKEKMLQKILETLNVFRQNQDSIALLWRPHPLIFATLQAMHPELWEIYSRIVKQYQEEEWGIYDDTTDMNRAIALSDAYYGDSGSLLALYKKTGKEFYRPWIDTAMVDNGSNIILQCRCDTPDGEFAFSRINNALFRIVHDDKLHYIGATPIEPGWKKMLYGDMVCQGNKIYFAPLKAKQILIYDYVNNNFSEIPLEFPKVKMKFKKICIEERKAWFIPLEYPYVVCLDLVTEELENMDPEGKTLKEILTQNEYRTPEVDETKGIIYIGEYNSANVFVTYNKALGIYNDPEAMMIRADIEGNIIDQARYSVENTTDYKQAVGNTTKVLLEAIFSQVLRGRKKKPQEESNVGLLIHKMIMDDYKNEII